MCIIKTLRIFEKQESFLTLWCYERCFLRIQKEYRNCLNGCFRDIVSYFPFFFATVVSFYKNDLRFGKRAQKQGKNK